MAIMKTGVLALFVLFSACENNYPASKVPSVVLNTINGKFPGATDLDWEKKANSYEAEFDLNGIEHTAFVEPGGVLIWHKHDIADAALPEQVRMIINDQYKGYSLDEAEKVEKANVIYYQVELQSKGKKDVQMVFSAEGILTNDIAYLD